MSKKILNSGVILNVIGTLLIINGFLMLLSLPFAFYYDLDSGGDVHLDFIISSAITLFFGVLIKYLTKDEKNAEIKKRDGYLIVVGGWLFMSLFGTLPFLLSGAIPNFTNAFF